jgi:hypothetical protein
MLGNPKIESIKEVDDAVATLIPTRYNKIYRTASKLSFNHPPADPTIPDPEEPLRWKRQVRKNMKQNSGSTTIQFSEERYVS